MRRELRIRIFLNFVLVVALFGILCGVFGAWLINRATLNEAQQRVRLDLRSAWSVLNDELDRLRLLVGVLAPGRRVASAFTPEHLTASQSALEAVRLQYKLDFFSLTDPRGRLPGTPRSCRRALRLRPARLPVRCHTGDSLRWRIEETWRCKRIRNTIPMAHRQRPGDETIGRASWSLLDWPC